MHDVLGVDVLQPARDVCRPYDSVDAARGVAGGDSVEEGRDEVPAHRFCRALQPVHRRQARQKGVPRHAHRMLLCGAQRTLALALNLTLTSASSSFATCRCTALLRVRPNPHLTANPHLIPT